MIFFLINDQVFSPDIKINDLSKLMISFCQWHPTFSDQIGLKREDAIDRVKWRNGVYKLSRSTR